MTIHSDRGSPMAATNVATLSAGLGVIKSHSRPKMSNNNPYSESRCKTLKYRHDFPDRFGCIEDAHAWCESFFDLCNLAHRHFRIALHAPFDVHFGLAEQLREMRADVLADVCRRHPEQFVRKAPAPPKLPDTVWTSSPPAPTGTIKRSRHGNSPNCLPRSRWQVPVRSDQHRS
nr:hypothetical protein [Streptomyces atratus]